MHILQVPRKEFRCQGSLEHPLFEIDPSVNQLVFEGDSFALHCHVSNTATDTEIFWAFNNETLSSFQSNLTVAVNLSLSHNGSLLSSSLHVNKIHALYSGVWKCFANSSNGSDSRSVQVFVISTHGKFCPQVSSHDNKGRYEWPATPAGITVELECAGKRASSLTHQSARAYHTCTSDAVWKNVNTSMCPYMSEVTNVLEHFSKANFSFAHASVLNSARLLQNYTSGNQLNDKMDIVFICRALQNYIHAVAHNLQIAEVIIDIINTLMTVDKQILKAAELEDQACTKLIDILESLPELLSDVPLNYATENIAIEDFFIKSERFPGIICFSSMKISNLYSTIIPWRHKLDYKENLLKCNIANTMFSLEEVSNSMEASLYLPPTIFQQTGFTSLSVSTYKLQFIIYRNSLLFPHAVIESQQNDVTSLIISGKIAHANIKKLTEPIIVSLRASTYTSDIRPVWWNAEAHGGRGDWSDDGCYILKVHSNVVTFSCNRLSSFGLMQDMEALLRKQAFERAQFHFAYPAIYIGSTFCIIPIAFTIVIYCLTYRKLKMPDKMKHSLINTFLSLVLLCITFSLGVTQTDILPVCQAIGFMLHYFTLCPLFWMLVTASNLYKKLAKTCAPAASSRENLSDQNPLPPKPMLRFYLVGWGISLIICGISAAIDVGSYGGTKFCFLSLNPCLGALCAPALCLLFLLSCLYLLIYCAIRGKHSAGCVSNRDGILIELHETDNVIGCEVGSGARTSDCEESILSFELQLQGHATLLLLFLLTWLSAYVTVGRPLGNNLPHDEVLFGFLFCCFGSLLGIYCFILFCYCQTDRKQYLALSFCKILVPAKKVPEAIPMIAEQTVGVPSSISPGAVADLLTKTSSAHDSTSLHHNSANAHSSEHSASNAKVFYDPKQSELARRFFEKSHRQRQAQHGQRSHVERSMKNKTESFENVKVSKTSNSSHIADCQSEYFHEDISSGSQNSSSCMYKRRYLQVRSENEGTVQPFKCKYLNENTSNISSGNSQLQTSVCHSFCSDISSDVLSKSNTHRKHRDRSYCKCCGNYSYACQQKKKHIYGTSFSAENLEHNLHCFCQSYSPCKMVSSNDTNIQSNSEISVTSTPSCRYLNND